MPSSQTRVYLRFQLTGGIECVTQQRQPFTQVKFCHLPQIRIGRLITVCVADMLTSPGSILAPASNSPVDSDSLSCRDHPKHCGGSRFIKLHEHRARHRQRIAFVERYTWHGVLQNFWLLRRNRNKTSNCKSWWFLRAGTKSSFTVPIHAVAIQLATIIWWVSSAKWETFLGADWNNRVKSRSFSSETWVVVDANFSQPGEAVGYNFIPGDALGEKKFVSRREIYLTDTVHTVLYFQSSTSWFGWKNETNNLKGWASKTANVPDYV